MKIGRKILYNLDDMVGKLGISISLLGFSIVSGLLATGHWGMAIRVTNYIYYFLIITILGLAIQKKNEKL